MTKSTKNRPTHHLYVVTGDGEDAIWAQIAPAWEHQKGDGLNIVIPPGVTVSGKLVIRAAKEANGHLSRIAAPLSRAEPLSLRYG